MHCRRCNRDTPVFRDIMDFRPVDRCAHCGQRHSEGPMLPGASRQRSVEYEVMSHRDAFATAPTMRADHDEKRGRPKKAAAAGLGT